MFVLVTIMVAMDFSGDWNLTIPKQGSPDQPNNSSNSKSPTRDPLHMSQLLQCNTTVMWEKHVAQHNLRNQVKIITITINKARTINKTNSSNKASKTIKTISKAKIINRVKIINRLNNKVNSHSSKDNKDGGMINQLKMDITITNQGNPDRLTIMLLNLVNLDRPTHMDKVTKADKMVKVINQDSPDKEHNQDNQVKDHNQDNPDKVHNQVNPDRDHSQDNQDNQISQDKDLNHQMEMVMIKINQGNPDNLHSHLSHQLTIQMTNHNLHNRHSLRNHHSQHNQLK